MSPSSVRSPRIGTGWVEAAGSGSLGVVFYESTARGSVGSAGSVGSGLVGRRAVVRVCAFVGRRSGWWPGMVVRDACEVRPYVCMSRVSLRFPAPPVSFYRYVPTDRYTDGEETEVVEVTDRWGGLAA